MKPTRRCRLSPGMARRTEIEPATTPKPAFSAPQSKEPALTKPDPAFAAREADVTARERG